MSAIDTLRDEVKAWRAATSAPAKARDENAQALYELNMAWGKVKAENDARIEPQRQEYLKEQARLQALIPPKPKRPKGPKGRPRRAPYTDAVKIAAYLAVEEGGRSITRVALSLTGTKDNELFQRTIREGKDLYELQQASQDRRAAQATEPDESEEW